MNISDIELKIEEEKKALSELEEKRKKLDKRISEKQNKISDLEKMKQAKEYTEIDNKLDSLGLSREELLNALMKGDLSSLQNKIGVDLNTNLNYNSHL